MSKAAPHVSRYGTATIYVVLTLAGLGLLLSSSEAFHVHESDTPALYDAECPLQFAASHSEESLRSSPPSVWTRFVGTSGLCIEQPVSLAVVAHEQDCRAPPLA